MPAYSSFSDLELTIMLKSGDHAAFNEIYKRFQGLLYIYACKVVKNDEEAEDIVQEIFLYLWDKRSIIIFKSGLAVYLYTAVRYKFFNLLDHKKVRTDYKDSLRHFLDQGVTLTDHYIREKELSKLIEAEINALPHKMREIFELSRKHNLSRKEISEKMNISEKTVKNQINNALKILRSRLGLWAFILLLINRY